MMDEQLRVQGPVMGTKHQIRDIGTGNSNGHGGNSVNDSAKRAANYRNRWKGLAIVSAS